MGQSSIGLKAEDKQGITIHTVKEPMYRRDLTKHEGGIMPDAGSTIIIGKQKEKLIELNAFEQQVNGRVIVNENQFQKFTFASKETFD